MLAPRRARLQPRPHQPGAAGCVYAGLQRRAAEVTPGGERGRTRAGHRRLAAVCHLSPEIGALADTQHEDDRLSS